MTCHPIAESSQNERFDHLGGPQCPLCKQEHNTWWHQRKHRDYWHCRICQLVFVGVAQQLSATAEKAEYDRHENDVDDPGYRRFLTRPFTAVTERLPAGARGLDFGCGPGPALAAMLEESGYDVTLYDLYYYPQAEALTRHYDFICLTEVIEHLSDPARVLTQLWALLNEGGWLVVQTQRVRNRAAFEHWRYVDDPTHIAFYAEDTFAWLARQLDARHWDITGRDVVVLQK
jgi:2-polyprenyl-3-methyl-5-hydroxy-6-metoxy-1,4-benzoquinol methylase